MIEPSHESNSQTAWIIGNGGHAKVVASFLPHHRIRHLVERNAGEDDRLQSDFLADPAPPEPADYFIAIGDNAARQRWFARLKALGITPARCIAPTAWIAPTALLGDGVFVGAGAVIGADARIGDNAIVNNLSLVDHEGVVGEDSQLAPGVILGGQVLVGRRCFLGIRSCVAPRLEIGDDAFVMAGAVVVTPVPPGAKVGGVPATIRPASQSPGTRPG